MVFSVDSRGDGYLDFSSDRWPEGAVILGHLQTVDDGTESRSAAVEDRTGAWGLRVRSPQNRFLSIGFLNAGQALIPADSNIKGKAQSGADVSGAGGPVGHLR